MIANADGQRMWVRVLANTNLGRETVLLHFHGGGFVVGHPWSNNYDSLCRARAPVAGRAARFVRRDGSRAAPVLADNCLCHWLARSPGACCVLPVSLARAQPRCLRSIACLCHWLARSPGACGQLRAKRHLTSLVYFLSLSIYLLTTKHLSILHRQGCVLWHRLRRERAAPSTARVIGKRVGWCQAVARATDGAPARCVSVPMTAQRGMRRAPDPQPRPAALAPTSKRKR
jgi:hypothetical protein